MNAMHNPVSFLFLGANPGMLHSASAVPICPDRPRNPYLGPTTQITSMLFEDVLRAHRHLLTAAPPEGLMPLPEQPLRPTLPSVFLQLPRRTSSSNMPSMSPSS